MRQLWIARSKNEVWLHRNAEFGGEGGLDVDLCEYAEAFRFQRFAATASANVPDTSRTML